MIDCSFDTLLRKAAADFSRVRGVPSAASEGLFPSPGERLGCLVNAAQQQPCDICLQSTGTTSANAIDIGTGCAYIGIISNV